MIIKCESDLAGIKPRLDDDVDKFYIYHDGRWLPFDMGWDVEKHIREQWAADDDAGFERAVFERIAVCPVCGCEADGRCC